MLRNCGREGRAIEPDHWLVRNKQPYAVRSVLTVAIEARPCATRVLLPLKRMNFPGLKGSFSNLDEEKRTSKKWRCAGIFC